MAIVRAVKSGNWSDTTVWNTGALPTSADDVYSNTFTVTIDVSPTVLSISNAAATGVTAGGSFVPTNGITLTCTGAGIVPGSSLCLSSSLGVGESATLVAACNAAAATGIACRHSGLGTLNIVGNCTGSNSGGSPYYGVQNSSAGVINIIGTCTGNGNANHGVINSSSGIINVTGTCTSIATNNGSSGVANVSTGTVNITGSCVGPLSAIFANPWHGALNSSTGTLNLTGNATGGGGSASHGVVNSSTGTLTHYGTATAGPLSQGIFTSSTGIAYLTGPFIGTSLGVSALSAGRWRWVSSVGSSYMTAVNSDTTGYKNLYTADSTLSNSGQPATNNVRSGTIYGPNSELTGTCAVPAASSVAFGVPVDATTGTAVLTPESVRAAVGLASANLDTQLGGIPTALENASAVRTELATELGRIDTTVSSRSTFNPTTDIVGRVTLVDTTTDLTNPPVVPTPEQIATAVATELDPTLTEIDNNVLSRLAAADYVAPPTALENAEAVEIQLALPLGNLDAAISSRSIFNPVTDTVAHVTLVDTTTDLTNPPDVPTTAEIATAVVTELGPTLSEIDSNVLSRLAEVDYTAPPTSEQNAEAVRVELTPELERVANSASTQQVADIVGEAFGQS